MKHILPSLSYSASSLEPFIDADTMSLHHDYHHAAYVEKLNAAIAPYPELQGRSAGWLLRNRGKVPAAAREVVHNNAGGHLNHSMYWQSMSPQGGGEPTGRLAEAINRDFGGFIAFKKKFAETGIGIFGAGWVWLVIVPQQDYQLKIETTANHDNPLTLGHFPLMVNDLWEHAYYLKHKNLRQEYLDDWWSVANWRETARQFELSQPDHEDNHHDEPQFALAAVA